MRVLDDAAAGFLFRDEQILGGVEFVDALNGTHVDASPILHVDARFGDDRQTSHGSSSNRAQ